MPDGRLVELFLFLTLLDKSPLTFVYFVTFAKKREVGSPLPHNQTFWFLVNMYLPKTKKFGCVGRGELTSLFFSKVVKY